MGYFIDMQDIPTDDLIDSIFSIISKRNGLITNGRCPYCGWDKNDARPHSCKYSGDVDKFQKGIVEITAKGYVSNLPPGMIPLITPQKMAKEKVIKDDRHAFDPHPIWSGLCKHCGEVIGHILHKEPKYAATFTIRDFVDMKAGKEEMLKFMQEHQDELRTALGMGKVNKTRERIAELTAEVEHEKNKATISIGSLQQHIRELKEQKQGLRDDIDKLRQKTVTDPELKPLTWMRIDRRNTGHCEKFTLHCEAGGFQIDLPLMEFDHGSHSITEETLSACERLGICSNNYISNTPGITEIKPLTFSALREANRKRLPLFKDKHGNICHKIPNVTDWTIDQWHTATSGELGEFANLVKKFNRGDLNSLQFHELARMELADVNTYLDMLADRCGIDLAQAIVEKFNEVSVRVGCDIRL